MYCGLMKLDLVTWFSDSLDNDYESSVHSSDFCTGKGTYFNVGFCWVELKSNLSVNCFGGADSQKFNWLFLADSGFDWIFGELWSLIRFYSEPTALNVYNLRWENVFLTSIEFDTLIDLSLSFKKLAISRNFG